MRRFKKYEKIKNNKREKFGLEMRFEAFLVFRSLVNFSDDKHCTQEKIDQSNIRVMNSFLSAFTVIKIFALATEDILN
jgi:hypothetical protein